MQYNEFDLSSTGKTVKEHAIMYIITTLTSLANKIEQDIEDKRKEKIAESIPSHQMRISHYRADNEISNKDIMCKICVEIQKCSLVIINISGLNPNVMLEQGIAYGLGKPVIIIKDKKTPAINDLGSIEYIEYDHAYDLMTKLQSIKVKLL